MKIGVSFPIVGAAYDECVDVNRRINALAGSLILFGPEGNSSPHVTLAMGTLRSEKNVADLESDITGLLGQLERPVFMKFGPIYRERVTGHYVFSDVTFSSSVNEWRLVVQDIVGPYFLEPARTSEVPHLTLAHVADRLEEIDIYLADLANIDASVTNSVDISESGPKGVKQSVLRKIIL